MINKKKNKEKEALIEMEFAINNSFLDTILITNIIVWVDIVGLVLILKYRKPKKEKSYT